MELSEKSLSTTKVFDGRLLQVYADRVQLPDGSTSGREYIRHPGGVGIVALTDDGQVLLVRQFRYPYGEVVTEIPAGKRDPGEEPLTTARRELEEETGMQAACFKPLGAMYPSPGYTDEVDYLYLATGLRPTHAHPDEDEFLDVVSMPLEDALNGVLDGTIPDAKTQIALLKVARLLQE